MYVDFYFLKSVFISLLAFFLKNMFYLTTNSWVIIQWLATFERLGDRDIWWTAELIALTSLP